MPWSVQGLKLVFWIPGSFGRHFYDVQSDHRLVVSKVELKLKAKRRRAQKEPGHQVDMRQLGDQEVEDFRNALAENLSEGPVAVVEEVWGTL